MEYAIWITNKSSVDYTTNLSLVVCKCKCTEITKIFPYLFQNLLFPMDESITNSETTDWLILKIDDTVAKNGRHACTVDAPPEVRLEDG